MDLVVRSGLWLVATALAMLLAAGAALGAMPDPAVFATVGLGTMSVYGFDRLIYLPRGRGVSRWLVLAWVLAAGVAAAIGLTLPHPAILVLAAVCALSLAHAGLRKVPWVKPAYIALAWMGVTWVLPWLLSGATVMVLVDGLSAFGLVVVANVLACDAIDREGEARQLGPRRLWILARWVAGTGVMLTLISAPTRPLAVIPAVMLIALIPLKLERRWSERVLDGSVLVGALVAYALFRIQG